MGRDDEPNEIVGPLLSAADGVHDALAFLGRQAERGFAGVTDASTGVLPTE
jgi:hypothetical protein